MGASREARMTEDSSQRREVLLETTVCSERSIHSMSSNRRPSTTQTLLFLRSISSLLLLTFLTHLTMASSAQYDVIIVGSGLAGMSAALECTSNKPNARVLMLEKEARTGGNSAKASSGISAALDDSDIDAFERDTTRSAGADHARAPLIRTLVSESGSAIDFLTSFGVDLSLLSQLGGHSRTRTHRNRQGANVGFAITSALRRVLDARTDSVTIMTGARVVELGSGFVRFEKDGGTHRAEGRSVILATGGFAASADLLARHSPGLERLPTTNGAWASGDGLALGVAAGAALVDMDQVQIHPTGFVDRSDPEAHTKFLAPEALRGSGAILLDHRARRFVDELTTRDKVSAAILALPRRRCFLLLGEDGAALFGSALKFYLAKGLMSKVESLEEIARFIAPESGSDVIASSLREELGEYGKADDAFGKTVFPSSFPDPESLLSAYYVAEVVPVVHYTMGGLRINERAEILDDGERPIANLFGAGEVTGGVHGHNRLGGNSLLECVVFGRIAARQACHVTPRQEL